jgi:hypothetical protein
MKAADSLAEKIAGRDAERMKMIESSDGWHKVGMDTEYLNNHTMTRASNVCRFISPA